MSKKVKSIAPLQATLALDPLAAGYTIPGVGDQTVNGDDGSNSISTGSGLDTINGGLGADTIKAGTGDDEILNLSAAGLLGDKIDGGLGFDVLGIDFSDASKGVSFAAFDPIVSKAVLGATIVNVESFELEGSNFADSFTGGRWNDWFEGGASGLSLSSIENVVGRTSDDTIFGNGVANTLEGGIGDDRLDGRAGNDILEGGGHGDLLTGGSGADKFIYASEEAIGSGDQITDFKRGEDKLVVDKSVFGFSKLVLYSGNDLKATGTAAQFFFEKDNGRLWYDADGTGNEADAVLVATLDKVTSLATTDFLLI
ncbi:Ca2+-binding RTX toxin-like protein [Sinorhizobium fredii]|uniref:calcium-binding protein n=1 Tax=Rhizobium fredii TaxID=380 RepID=UPI00351102BB